VLVAEARAAGRDWVIAHAAVTPGFRGAFFSGSVASRPETAEQPRWSDVDVMVVLATDPVPPKPGKIRHRGALLDVTYLPWSLVTDIDVVARSYHLAPCFTGDHVILDPTGHLRLLRDTIAPSFADAVAVERRYEDVITALEARLAVLDPAAAWHDQVMAWMFPASLPTHVVLVAARRNPTVRLRYLAAREVLAVQGLDGLYARLLELLGCAGCHRETVQCHLDRLAVVFDEAVGVSRTPFFFSSDITAAARMIAIDGSQHLVDDGDHREGVFWIIATFARCQQILAVDAPLSVRRGGAAAFRAAVDDLLGLRDFEGLRDRATAVRALLPELRRAAASISTSPGDALSGCPVATGGGGSAATRSAGREPFLAGRDDLVAQHDAPAVEHLRLDQS
jgi:hypothetical protein